MSHFTVLVTRTNKKPLNEQLEPFDEDKEVEWVDTAEEHRQEYETETTKEFYDASSSSWGQQITKELFDKIRASRVGAIHHYKIVRNPGQYFKKGESYQGYYELPDHKRCKGDAWFFVEEINESDHPDKDVAFEGDITIRVIAPPKKISLKDKYPDYNTYLLDYHGIKDVNAKEGYWRNPDGRWDWYVIGGRWLGYFILRSGTRGQLGKSGTGDNKPEHDADVAKAKDIDWEAMRANNLKRAEKTWAEYEAKKKSGAEFHPYFDFGIEKEEADNRSLFIKRNSSIATFAVLHDGQWYSRGNMGWWGAATNEKEQDEWQAEFDKIIASLDPDDEVTLIDCHT